MDIDEPSWPLIDDFFRAEAVGKSTATIRRYARVRGRLLAFLDTGDMTPGLGTDDVALLESERQFHETGAFWSVFGTDELVCCLPGFLGETWLPDGLAEARVQVSLIGRLLTFLSRHPDSGWSGSACAWYEAESAVEQARREVSLRPVEPPGPQAMPARFHQPPGPQW